jgi:hypothetical protein
MNVWIGLTRLWNGSGSGLFWTQQWIGYTEGNSFHDQLRVTELHRRKIHSSYVPTLPGTILHVSFQDLEFWSMVWPAKGFRRTSLPEEHPLFEVSEFSRKPAPCDWRCRGQCTEVCVHGRPDKR